MTNVIANYTTTNYYIPLPYIANRVVDDLSRIVTAIVTIDSLLAAKLDSSQRGAINGVATLDGNGRLTSTQLPVFTGDITSTAGSNTLTLSATGVTPGTYSKVTVDDKGRVSVGANPITLSEYGITDALTSLNTTWAMCSDNGETFPDDNPHTLLGGGVLSVNGKLGTIVLNKYDIGLELVDNTPDVLKPLSNAATIAIAGKQNALISGVNIKTINGLSILGPGNILIVGGDGSGTGGGTGDWSSILNTPSTLAGYGIVDATPLSHTTNLSQHLTVAQNTLLDSLTVSATELNYTSGVRSSIQTQIDAKQATLASGTNIKSINGTSLVGSGDLYISGGLKATTIKTGNYSAVANDLVRVDATFTATTITLPSNISDGSMIGVIDVASKFNTNNVTINPPNGITIESDTSLVLDVDGTYVTLTYIASTTNWKLLEIPVLANSTDTTVVSPYTGAVKSVAGRVGDVILTANDIGLNLVDNVKQLPYAQKLVLVGDIVSGSTDLWTGSISTVLSLTGVTPGTYNSATSINPLTIDAKGRVTAVGAAVSIGVNFNAITNKPSTITGYGLTTIGTGDVLLNNAPTITSPTITSPVITGKVMMGTTASTARFPFTTLAISNTAIGSQQNESHNIGLLAEGTGNATNASFYGVGVFGSGYTNSGAWGVGVFGKAHALTSSDTGSAVGVGGYSNDTHAGGANIGLYGDATNGLTNYALYLNNGGIYTNGATTWTLNGNLTISGSQYITTIPTLNLGNPLGANWGGTGLTSPGASGNVLTSNGTAWTSAAPTSGTGATLTVLANNIIQLSDYFTDITWGNTNSQSYGWLIQRTYGVSTGVAQFALIQGGYRPTANGGCKGTMLPFQINADNTITIGSATTMWTNSTSPYDFSTCSLVTDNKSGMFHYSGNIPWPGTTGHVMGWGYGRLNANNTGDSFYTSGTTNTQGIHDHNGQYFGLPYAYGNGWRGVNAGYASSNSTTRIHQIEFIGDGTFTTNVQDPSANTSTSPVMQLFLGPNSTTANTAISGISHWRNSSNVIVARVFAGSSGTYYDWVGSGDWSIEYYSSQFVGFALSDGSVLVYHTPTVVYRYTAYNSRTRVYPTTGSTTINNIITINGGNFPIPSPDFGGCCAIPDGDNTWLYVEASSNPTILRRISINISTLAWTTTVVGTLATGGTSYLKLNALPNNRIMLSQRAYGSPFQYIIFNRPA